MNDAIQLILNSSLTAKLILLILFILSVISWGIIIEKIFVFRKVHRENVKFTKLFAMRIKWNDRFNYSREFKASPMAKLFRKNYRDIQLLLGSPSQADELRSIDQQPHEIKVPSIPLRSLFEVGISEEVALLERHLVVLATTVSVSPFLGLLGTVWGIMTSFLSMGTHFSAEIRAVGPGIAEALITTIAGLAVAIPALVGHNYLASKLNLISNDLENFFNNLGIIIEKERFQ